MVNLYVNNWLFWVNSGVIIRKKSDKFQIQPENIFGCIVSADWTCHPFSRQNFAPKSREEKHSTVSIFCARRADFVVKMVIWHVILEIINCHVSKFKVTAHILIGANSRSLGFVSIFKANSQILLSFLHSNLGRSPYTPSIYAWQELSSNFYWTSLSFMTG